MITPASNARSAGAPGSGTPPPDFDGRRFARRLGALVVLAAMIVLAVSVLPGLEEVRDRFAGADGEYLVLALALKLASVAAFVAAFRGVFCPRLPWRLSFEVASAEQATNVLVPTGGAGGVALGAWALQRGGMLADHVVRRSVAFFLLTSSVNVFAAVVAGSLVMVGVLGPPEPLVLTLGPVLVGLVLIGGVVVLGAALPRVASSTRRRRRIRAGLSLGDGIRDALGLLRQGHPLVLAGPVGYMAFDMAALAASFRAFGHVPPLGTLMLAYVIGQLGGLIPLPGGFGGTDGGLIAAFAVYGTSATLATAAVLAYRAFQLGVPVLLGAIALPRLRRSLAGTSGVAALCEPMTTARRSAGHHPA